MLEVKHVFLIHWWNYSRSVDSSVNMPLRSGGPLVPLLYKCYLRKFKLSRSSFQTQPTFWQHFRIYSCIGLVLLFLFSSSFRVFYERYNWAWSNFPSVFYGIVERVTCFQSLDQKTGEADFIHTGHLEMDYLKHFFNRNTPVSVTNCRKVFFMQESLALKWSPLLLFLI